MLEAKKPAARPTRSAHVNEVLEELRRRGALSRAELGAATGLSRATISSIVGMLMEAGSIITAKGRDTERQVGRRPELVALSPRAGILLGVEFGHTRVTVVAANIAHEILGSRSRAHPATTEWNERIEYAQALIAETIREAGSSSRLTAIGVGVPGRIARRASVVSAVKMAIKQHGVPVRMDNNARLAGLSELYWGAARNISDFLYIRLSSGVGGAVILDGRILDGDNAAAGEFGHVCLDPNGPRCRCSNQGCLEAYVGIETLLANAAQPSVDSFVASLDRLESRSTAVLGDAALRIGVVLANACNILDISSIVLGGDLAVAGEHLLLPLRRAVLRHLHADAVERLDIHIAGLGPLDGALGGIALIIQDPGIDISQLTGAAGRKART